MSRPVSRKQFIQITLGVVGAGVLLGGCSSSSSAAPPASGGNCKANGAADGGIDDPKHHLVVPAADVVAGVDKTYSIQGMQTHDHMVTITAAQFAQLAANTTLPMIVSTTTLAHNHIFSVVCG
jgi:hypothetical protein